MVEKKVFRGEMVNVSASEYCESRGTRLSDYEMRGVFMKGGYSGSTIFESFRRDVPVEAEAVTNIRYLGTVTGESFFYAARRLEVMIGTALIPKHRAQGDPTPEDR
ncbi:hypothetical protein TVNIR_2010 [Thioalkalivibrio nitratireducens DSM 14787]|uniref:Uncharacterized protein n=1 Tax=Thioalkalivibrio nitratireducens (strain DSM 14787 / UNIQEM 213 / ALEN2) TaxID=1255043 RepID=L0DZ66_THIND|nr:hypothetical protein [Thioalkalivibrio nitratireducens]AGA33671.1 hypothetical protein TVNIR_2010 [Thioalkalivibrio nitratireducens DSM 14787]